VVVEREATDLILLLVFAGEGGDLDQIVGEDPLPGPGFRSLEAVQAGAVPSVSAFEGADPAFASGAPFDGSAERSAFLDVLAGGTGSALARDDDSADTELGQGGVDGGQGQTGDGTHMGCVSVKEQVLPNLLNSIRVVPDETRQQMVSQQGDNGRAARANGVRIAHAFRAIAALQTHHGRLLTNKALDGIDPTNGWREVNQAQRGAFDASHVVTPRCLLELALSAAEGYCASPPS